MCHLSISSLGSCPLHFQCKCWSWRKWALWAVELHWDSVDKEEGKKVEDSSGTRWATSSHGKGAASALSAPEPRSFLWAGCWQAKLCSLCRVWSGCLDQTGDTMPSHLDSLQQADTVPFWDVMGTRTADIRLVAPVGATPPLHFLAWVICALCSAFLLGSLWSKREASLPLGRGWLRLSDVFEKAFLPWGVFIWLLFSVLVVAVTGAAKSGQGHAPGSAGLWSQSQAQETNEDAWKKYMAKS